MQTKTAPDSRNRAWLRVAATIVLALVPACSGGGPGGNHSALSLKPIKWVGNFGPSADGTSLLGMVTAARVDERGRPVAPSVHFSPTDPQVAALVLVGGLASPATLAVAWSQLDGSGKETPLFEHRIKVHARQWAYSIGRSPGKLAAGTYEVVARIGDQELTTWWQVTEEGEASVLLEGASATFPLDASSFDASGARLVGDVEAGPPKSGHSGVIDEWGPGTAGECSFDVSAEAYVLDVEARAGTGTDSPPCGEAVLSAWVEGSPMEVDRATPEAVADINPCHLPGGSDLPGAVVHVSGSLADGSQTMQEDVELIDLGLGPLIAVVEANPPIGSRVEAGDKVHLVFRAVEVPWTTGIHRMAVSFNGAEAGSWDSGASEPTKCDFSRYFQQWSVDATVPADPPAVIEIAPTVEDYAGHKGFAAWHWATKGSAWNGTMSAGLTQQVPGGTQEASAEFTIVLTEDAKGNLVGEIDGKQIETLDLESCPSVSLTPGRNKADLTGTHRGDRIELKATGVQWTPPRMRPCPEGQEPGAIPGLLDPAYGPVLDMALHGLARGGDGSYAAQASGTLCSPAPCNVSYTLKLTPQK